jgi:hypothetical protein
MNKSNVSETEYFLSRDQYVHYIYIIYLIGIPVISLIGISGNSISLYVLQKYPTKHTFATYVKALTSVDTVLLVAASIRSLFKACLYVGVDQASAIDIYGEFYLGLVIGGLLQRLSSSFITVISIERFLAVHLPLRVRSLFIETRPSTVMAVVVIFNILLQLPTFIFVEVKKISLYGNITIHILSRTNIAVQQPTLTSAYLFSIAGFGVAIPLFIVLISTCCIIVQVNMYKNTTRTKLKVSRGSFETDRMTVTLIGMATCFTFMSVPAVCIYVWSAIDRSVEYTYLRRLFVDVNVFLICMNSGCDFIIYCLTSKTFRVLFFDTFTCTRKSLSQPAPDSRIDNQMIETVSGITEDVSDSNIESLQHI